MAAYKLDIFSTLYTFCFLVVFSFWDHWCLTSLMLKTAFCQSVLRDRYQRDAAICRFLHFRECRNILAEKTFQKYRKFETIINVLIKVGWREASCPSSCKIVGNCIQWAFFQVLLLLILLLSCNLQLWGILGQER